MSPVGALPYFPGGSEEAMERPATCREGFLDNGNRHASAWSRWGPPIAMIPSRVPKTRSPARMRIRHRDQGRVPCLAHHVAARGSPDDTNDLFYGR